MAPLAFFPQGCQKVEEKEDPKLYAANVQAVSLRPGYTMNVEIEIDTTSGVSVPVLRTFRLDTFAI